MCLVWVKQTIGIFKIDAKRLEFIFTLKTKILLFNKRIQTDNNFRVENIIQNFALKGRRIHTKGFALLLLLRLFLMLYIRILKNVMFLL